MPVQFLDGPAGGSKVWLHRAPAHVRVVMTADGRVDVLDMLDDEPRADEQVHVYRLVRGGMPPADTFVCVDDGAGGYAPAAIADADYRHRPEVDGEQLRDTAAWRRWAEENGPEGSVNPLTRQPRG